MGDNTYGYRRDGLLQNFGRRPEKFSNGTTVKETTLSGDLTRIVQHDGWNQPVGFRDNLSYAGGEIRRNNRPSSGQDISPTTWDNDRREGHRRNSSNPLDMTLPARSQHRFSHAESSSIQGAPHQQSFVSNSSSSSYNARSSHFSRPNQSSPYTSNRTSEALLQTRDPAELNKFLRDSGDVNGLQTLPGWRSSFHPNEIPLSHIPSYAVSQHLHKSRCSRNSPIPDTPLHLYPPPEKREDNHNSSDRKSLRKTSPYDNFPRQFEHMRRPLASGGLQPGIDMNLPHTNGPKPYMSLEPIHSSKFMSDLGSSRQEHRGRSFTTLQNSAEEPNVHAQPKKISFSIEDITRYTSNSTPNLVNNSNSSSRPRKPPDLPVIGSDTSRLSSATFPQTFYNLSTQPSRDAPMPYSVPSQLISNTPQYYLYPYLSSSSLPISGHGSQIATEQHPHHHQQQLLHQQLPKRSTFLPAETSKPGFARSMTEQRSVHLDNTIQDSRSLDYDRNLKVSEVRETRLDRDVSVNLISNDSTSNSLMPARNKQVTPARHLSPTPPPFVRNPTMSEPTPSFSHDVDMRQKISEVFVNDTDLRVHTNPSTTVNSSVLPEPASRANLPEKTPNSNSHSDPLTLNKTINFKDVGSKEKHGSSAGLNKNLIHDSVKNKIKRKYTKSGHSKIERQSSKDTNEKKEKIKQDIDRRRAISNLYLADKPNEDETKADSELSKRNDHVTAVDESSNLVGGVSKTETKPKGKRGGYKRKKSLDPVANHLAEKQTGIDIRKTSLESDAESKRGKRRKKSEQENEYIYWMFHDSSTEPENDDSEDEDFRCPILKPTQSSGRGRKRTMRTRPMRQSRRSACNSFFEPSSPEEHSPDDDKVSSKASSKPIKKEPGKRGPKPGSMRGIRRGPRKLKRSRKLSSDSDNSVSEVSDGERALKKKRKAFSSSDKSGKDKDEFLPGNRVGRRGRVPKKVLIKKKKKKYLIRKRENDSKKEKGAPRRVGRPPKYKKIPSSIEKDKSKITEVNKGESNIVNDPEIKENLPHDKISEVTTVEIKNKEIVSNVKNEKFAVKTPEVHKKKRGGKRVANALKQQVKLESSVVELELKSSEKKKSEDEAAKTQEAEASLKKPTDSSCSLVDLFNGKHKPPSLSGAECEPNMAEKQLNPCVNNLFADALTETEALALDAATKNVCPTLDTDILANTPKPTDPFQQTNTTSLTSSNQAPLKFPTVSSCKSSSSDILSTATENSFDLIPKLSLQTSTVVETPKQESVKVVKKRGRPKLLVSPKNNNTPAPADGVNNVQTKLKMRPKKIKKSSTQTKYKLKNKLLKKESDLIRPRAGRPPSSDCKKKFKHNVLNQALKNKTGRKKPVEVATKLSEINASLPRVIVPNSPLTAFSSNKKLSAKFPISQRVADKDRSLVSPSSSIVNTPISSKLLNNVALSRGSTPLSHLKIERRTPASSPLPPNIKKLTCKAAIGETVLHKAAQLGYMDNILHYLKQGFDVNTKDNAGYTALHEACVKGRVEAARLLLEFGADVNINSEDGTRPIHDAVEYDNVEMTRLLLACGADPILSKFSGRGIREMIRGSVMKEFLTAYLTELKPPVNNDVDEGDHKWDIPASAIFDKKHVIGCDILANPPEDDTLCDEMEFELLDEEPQDTYLVRASDTSNLSNYYLLSDLLEHRNCTRDQFLLQNPVDVKYAQAKIVTGDAEHNWISKKLPKCNESDDTYIDLVAHESLFPQGRRFVVSNDGTVALAPTKQPRSKQSKPWRPRGAYCAKRKFVDIYQPPEILPESTDVPSSSKSPLPSCENKSASSSDSEMRMSGVTELTTTLDDLKDDISRSKIIHPTPEINNAINSFHKEIENMAIYNEVKNSPTRNEVDTTSVHDEEINSIVLNGPWNQAITNSVEPVASSVQSSHYHGFDIARYSPTSDLRPPVLADNDPTRALTETENAVLNLAIGARLSSIPYHCRLQRSDTAKQFINNFNKSPKPPNHVGD